MTKSLFALALAGGALLATPLAASETVHFTYDGEHGPAHWGSLSGDWESCGIGQQQSPVDLPETAEAAAVTLSGYWPRTEATVINNGHTVQISPEGDGGRVTFDGTEYRFLQVHFHHLSEHSFSGRHTEMEAHFVHASDTGALLVLGVMMSVGGPPSALDELLGAALALDPVAGDAPVALPVSLDAQAALTGLPRFYTYAGSLTTPPCSQSVTWIVYADPVGVSAGNAARFGRLIGSNARPVQPLNDRVVRMH
ncbi:MAG: carbonic anhydrase [Pararhodobacter sp.]